MNSIFITFYPSKFPTSIFKTSFLFLDKVSLQHLHKENYLTMLQTFLPRSEGLTCTKKKYESNFSFTIWGTENKASSF